MVWGVGQSELRCQQTRATEISTDLEYFHINLDAEPARNRLSERSHCNLHPTSIETGNASADRGCVNSITPPRFPKPSADL
jgi:hypothetical protein